jgi:hypothetical protein
MKELTPEEQRYVEASKHIIKFEGFEIFEENGYEQVLYSDDNVRCLVDTYYHDELSWLKPIIKLIKKKGFKATLVGRYCNITADDQLIFKSPQNPNSDIESVWIPIVEFCKWYNNKYANEIS